jgi:2-polyprenyl-6-methoxyphenol hydroxylase-like FAD-dependent oxidoreductase
MDVCFLIFYIKKNVAIAAFENGETEYGDIFIGADGSNSKVKSFGKVNFTPVAVHEIVGISKKRAIDRKIVFQNTKSGLAALFQLPVMNRFGLCNMMSN